MRLMWKTVLLCLVFAAAGCQKPAADEKMQENSDSSLCSDAASACEPQETDGQETDTSWMQAITMEQAIDLFEQQGSGIVYFGFPACPWCQEAVPVLQEEAEAAGVDVFYVQTRDENKELLYTPEQKEAFTPWLKDYMSDNDEGVLTLFVPVVINVQNGSIVDGHVGTLDEHDATERKMSEEEVGQLHEIYKNLLEAGQ